MCVPYTKVYPNVSYMPSNLEFTIMNQLTDVLFFKYILVKMKKMSVKSNI